jgi:hypothetical protein
MFFFFPFVAEGGASPRSNGATLPLLPAPGRSYARSSDPRYDLDFGGIALGLLRQTLSAFTSSLTALGNRANALFAQVAAALAFDRVARDTTAFLQAAWLGFGVPRGRQSAFGFSQDPMSFGPMSMQSFMNPLAANPWAFFAEGLNFWTSLWMPAAPLRSSYSGAPANPFMAKVYGPGGLTWGFAWGR